MTRRLSAEDRELWERLRRSVRPLRADRAATDLDAEEPTDRPPSVSETKPAARPAAPTPAPLAPMEDKLRRRLQRGLAEVDDRIDLHGMRQERAFAALVAFLRRAQAHGAKTVLVITGKRREGEERGVLREAVPAWLSRPDFRDLVLGIDEAGRRHGGAGALYVRLRRRRRAGSV